MRHCPVCGARLTGGRPCAACSGAAIEVEDLHGDAEAVVGEVELGSPGGRRRWLGAAVVVAMLGGLVVAASLFGGQEAEVATPPSTSTTTSTTVPPRPTSTTVPAFVREEVWAPFLPSGSGAVLYGLSYDGEVVRIDVDRGVVTRRLLRGPRDARPLGFTVLARDGAAVLSGPGVDGALTVPDGPTARPFWLSLTDDGDGDARGGVLPAAAPGELWRLTTNLDGTVSGQRIDTLGRDVGVPVVVPSDAVVLGDDGTGALLARLDGSTVRVGFDGTERVGGADVVAWTAGTLVDRTCDGLGECRWQVVDRASGGQRAVPAPVSLGRASSAALSPDGSWLALVGADGRLVAVDLRDGTPYQLADDVADRWGFGYAAAGAWWTAESSHLFWLGADGKAHAWRVDDGELLVVDGFGRVPPLLSLSVAPASTSSG